MPSIRAHAAMLAFSAVLLAGCGTQVQNPVSGEMERSVLTEADEIRVGAGQHKQVLADYGRVDNPRLQAYVDGIGQRLAKSSQRPDLPWTFTVLDSPDINAFALPGGYIYVTRGIVAQVQDEAELAGIIGHEIGHVTARHGAQRATREQTAGLGVLAATVLGAVLESRGAGGLGQMASEVSQNVAAGYIASYSREQELQADRLGAEYLAGNGYEPRNVVEVLQMLQAMERYSADAARAEGRPAPQRNDWLASHPSSDQRVREAAALVQSIPVPAGAAANDGRERYLQMVDGITWGDGRDQGVTRGRNFFHEPMGIAITAPAGWRIVNGSSAVTLVNPAGDAGLVLRTVPPNAGASHEAVLRQLNPVSGRTEQRNLNGMAATHFDGTVRTAQGGTRAAAATVVDGPAGRRYLLAYAARDADALRRSRSQMREAESSFRPLSAADRSAARPWQIRTVTLPPGGFAELARTSPLGTGAEAQLRLLNGVYAGAPPPAGRRVKVVQ
jgi:predicted Zn-dependent protease